MKLLGVLIIGLSAIAILAGATLIAGTSGLAMLPGAALITAGTLFPLVPLHKISKKIKADKELEPLADTLYYFDNINCK